MKKQRSISSGAVRRAQGALPGPKQDQDDDEICIVDEEFQIAPGFQVPRLLGGLCVVVAEIALVSGFRDCWADFVCIFVEGIALVSRFRDCWDQALVSSASPPSRTPIRN